MMRWSEHEPPARLASKLAKSIAEARTLVDAWAEPPFPASTSDDDDDDDDDEDDEESKEATSGRGRKRGKGKGKARASRAKKRARRKRDADDDAFELDPADAAADAADMQLMGVEPSGGYT